MYEPSKLDGDAAVHTLKKRFVAIIRTLEEVSEDRAIGEGAHGLLTSVSSFSFLFYISVLDSLLGLSIACQYLQRKNVTQQSAGRSTSSAVSTFKRYRTDERLVSCGGRK